ncbi:sigma-70 family RNA polymerase sigma factor [Macrococcus equi]|uniref:sigma-70 family RNA polymerase sigma factor n=1 Tax=Macrococcus equi TaxID=3395462 RepID=UPI0039BE05CA
MFNDTKEKYDKMIYHFIHKYKLTYDLDEYYQLALIKLWELETHYDSLKTPNKDQYIYTKLNFFFIDEIRKLAKRTERYIATEDHLIAQQSICYDAYEQLNIEAFKNELTSNEYNWLILAIHGYKMKEIADFMNVSVSMIKRYKKNAQRKIKKLI